MPALRIRKQARPLLRAASPASAFRRLSPWQQYRNPFDNLLFFAAWPMLAAWIALYMLRDEDQLSSVEALWASGKVQQSKTDDLHTQSDHS